MKAIPLTSPNGTVMAYACGICLHVRTGGESFGLRNAEDIAAPTARYPVRIPRRFWRDLGRVVDPMVFSSRFGSSSNNGAGSPPEDPH